MTSFNEQDIIRIQKLDGKFDISNFNITRVKFKTLLKNWDYLNELAFCVEKNSIAPSIRSILLDCKFVRMIFKYSCVVDGFEEDMIAESKEDLCPICNKTVSDHEVLTYFQISSELGEFVKSINKQYLLYFIDSDSSIVLTKLRTDRMNTVLFVGAGISVPFGIPTWSQLIYSFKDELSEKENFTTLYRKTKIFEMINFLVDFAPTIANESSLKYDVCKKISDLESKVNLNKIDITNNMLDVLDFGSKLIVTCNYDNLLERSSMEFNEGYESNDVNRITSVENIRKRKTILHIHGNDKESTSIILTKKDYDSLYSEKNDVFKRKLQSLLGGKHIFFIGFSLTDDFVIKELLKIARADSNVISNYMICLPQEQVEDNGYTNENVLKIQLNDKYDDTENSDWITTAIHVVLMYTSGEIYI